MLRVTVVAAVLAAAALSGCGGDDDGGSESATEEPSGVSEISPDFKRAVAEAGSPRQRDFPAPAGRSLRALADSIEPGGQIGLATSVFTVGRNRLAFGMIDAENKLIYGKTAVYVAPKPGDQAQGPFVAPADSLVTEGQFRSQTAASESDTIAAIYGAQVPLEKPGKVAVLAITTIDGKQYGAATGITVRKRDPVVSVGEPAPEAETDTLATVDRSEEKLCTRRPIDEMHETSLDEVLGEKPVALLFSTPQLCESRVCGPVVDIAEQLREEYGDRVEFIHHEVYVDNDLQKGLRPPLREFGLPSEPWLFTIDESGKVAARLEGSFGVNSFRNALEAAL